MAAVKSATTSVAPVLDWISWGRVCAIAAVVAIHVNSSLVNGWPDTPAALWHFGDLMESASRWSVPLFVMMSGALSLPPRPGDDARTFWKRRAVRIGVPLVVWTVFFLWLDSTQTGQPITAYYLFQGFAWGKPYYHLYFLYVIAGLYLITPFLRTFVTGSTPRLRAAAAGVALGLASLNDLQHWLMGGGGGTNALTYFVPWIGYYLLGLVLAEIPLEGRRRPVGWWSGAVFVGTVAAIHGTTWLLFGAYGVQQGRYLYGYVAPSTILAGGALLLFLRAVTPSVPARVNRSVGRLAGLAFGIYLLHPIPLTLLHAVGEPRFGSPWAEIGYRIGLMLALLVGCGLVVAVLARVPVLRRLVT